MLLNKERKIMTHKYLTSDQLDQFDQLIDQDKNIPSFCKQNEVIREVCRSGIWLSYELEKLGCPESLIVRIQWTAGKLSFGKDPWKVHQKILADYQNNLLIFENDAEEKN